VDNVQVKAASMKPRGVAFAIEAVSQIPGVSEASFIRFERIVLAKMKEFIPHYHVKILNGFTEAG
jgi:hypothetical protein